MFHIRERLRSVGCSLEIDSAPGHGTRIGLIVPENHFAAPQPATRPAPAATGDAAAQPAGDGRPQEDGQRCPIRILVVDDHAVVREGLIAVLQREPDIRVVGEAADGQQAVEVAQNLEPDLVLMDVSLPGVNGIAAVHQIRMVQPHIRVVALSAHSEETTREAMLKAGAVTYLTKGGPSTQLVAAIRAAARQDGEN